MSFPHDHPTVVRQTVSWKLPVLLCGATFFLTILAIPIADRVRTPQTSTTNESATAFVEQSATVCPASTTVSNLSAHDHASSPNQSRKRTSSSSSSSSIVSQNFRALLTSPELLRQVWREVSDPQVDPNCPKAMSFSEEIEKLAQSLQVEMEESPLGKKRLRLSLSWPNPQVAAQVLKRLGDHFSNQYRTHWQTRREQEYQAAKNASDRALLAYEQAQKNVELLQEYLIHLNDSEKESVSDHFSNNDGKIPNPSWEKIQSELISLRDRETQLLAKMTEAHPEVSSLRTHILELENQLSVTPPTLPNQPPAKENSQTTPHASPIDDWKLLAMMEQEAREAGIRFQEAYVRKQVAAECRQLAPDLFVRVEEPLPQPAVSTSHRSIAWLFGLTMALGVGLIFSSQAVEPPVATLNDLQQLTDAPIVGAIPSYNPATDPLAIQRKKKAISFGLLLGGLVMIGFCVTSFLGII